MPSSNSTPIATALVCAAALGTAAWAHAKASKKSSTNSAAMAVDVAPLPPGAFDVAVVGAGPAGSTAAYYLAKGGARVILLEKEKFPREKPCHGALAAPACAILKDMGVLADLHGTVLAVASSEQAPAKGLHVERRALDATLAAAAAKAGADLRQGFEVSGLATSFDSASGMWTVRSTRSSFAGGRRSSSGVGGGASGSGSGSGDGGEIATGNEGGSIAARLLILADGAASTVGAELGFVAASKGASGGTEEAAVVVVPGPDAVAASAAPVQRVASHGVPRSYGDHWLIVGEAAGHAEAHPREKAAGSDEGQEETEKVFVFHGIHTAMRGGELAAAAALAMRSRGDFSASATRGYELAWRREFGSSAVDAWPRAVRRAVLEGRSSDLLESLSGELRNLKLLVSSKVTIPKTIMSGAALLPSSEGLKEKASSAAEAAKTALQSAAASAAAAARFGGASIKRMSFSGDGGGSKSSSREESESKSTAEAATASVEVSISPGRAEKGGENNLAAALAAEAEVVAAE